MPNILLTTGCNLSCTYCFAKEKMAGKRKDMSLEDVKKVIAFLKRSNSQLFRVMGGEPTLHKQFPEIMELALREGFRAHVLSNATWKNEYNDLFNKISPSRLLFLLNIDHPSSYTNKQWAKINHNIASIAGQRNITLSFNLFEKEPKFDYIQDICSTYGIDKVRMSFSLPVLDVWNAALEIEEYEELSHFIVHTVREAEAKGISIRFDNAVPLCVFSNEQAGELILKGVIDLKRNASCQPIIDIGPDLQIWSCFCLSKLYNRHLDEFDNLDQAQAYYQKVLDLYQGKVFPMEKCYQCAYKDLWGCQGGCLTYAIQRNGERYLDEPAHQEIQPLLEKDTILTLSEEAVLRKYEFPEESYTIRLKSADKGLELTHSFAPLWPLLDGKHSTEEIVQGFLGNEPQPEQNSPLAQFAQQVKAESITNILTGLMHEGIVVKKNNGRMG